MSTSDKLTYLNETKNKIKDAINLGDANITTETFRLYEKKIKQALINTMLDKWGIWDNFEKVTGTNTSLSLSPTSLAPISVDLKGNTQQGLPSEYQAVEYIESSGTQYIDTGLKGKNAISIDTDYSITSATTWASLLGCANGTAGNSVACVFGITKSGSINGGWYWRNTTNEQFDSNNVAQLDLKTNLKASATSFVFKNTNGTKTYSFSEVNSFETTPNMYIFASNKNGTINDYSKIKLYYMKIFDGTTLKREYLPCYRISDNVIGLYDMVENKFYTNAGTGTFTKGSNTTLPTPDYPQEIHNVSGDNTIEICGKNLFKEWHSGYMNTTTHQPTTGSRNITDYIQVRPSTKYTFWREDTGFASYAYEYDANYNYLEAHTITSNYTTISFTTKTNTKYVILYQYTDYAPTNKAQLEVGESHTTYEAYTGQSQLISLGVDMPSGYTRLDYIESSGTQYIDTGVIPTTQTGIKIQVEATTENNTDKILVGSRVGNNRFWIDFDGGSSKVVWGYGTYASTGTYSLNTKYDIDFNYNGSKEIKINGTSYNITGTYDNTGALSLYIFRANYTSAVAGNFKVYRCQIFEGTTKVRDLIPCKRDSDSAIGMLDLKHNVFYTNAGTGTFTYGNELPNGIELNKIGNYQDYIYKTDKWYKKGKVGKKIVTENEIIAQTDSYTNVKYFRINKESDDIDYNKFNATNIFYSSATLNNGYNYDSASMIGKINPTAEATRYWIGFPKSATTSEVQEKLTGSVLYYPLATETDTEITDSTLLSQLEAIKNMNSYDGTTNISQENNDLPFVIKARAIKEIAETVD